MCRAIRSAAQRSAMQHSTAAIAAAAAAAASQPSIVQLCVALCRLRSAAQVVVEHSAMQCNTTHHSAGSSAALLRSSRFAGRNKKHCTAQNSTEHVITQRSVVKLCRAQHSAGSSTAQCSAAQRSAGSSPVLAVEQSSAAHCYASQPAVPEFAQHSTGSS